MGPGLHDFGEDFGNPHLDSCVFQFAAQNEDLEAKKSSRAEDLAKYFPRLEEKSYLEDTWAQWMLQRLATEWPARFSITRTDKSLRIQCGSDYLECDLKGQLLSSSMEAISSLDGLSCFVNEDFAIWDLSGEQDAMTALHICLPNHWSPASKLGKSFAQVHRPVAGMDYRDQGNRMGLHMLEQEPVVRFASGLSTDDRYNHHPMPPHGEDVVEWKGRDFDPASPSLFMRTERQVLWPDKVTRSIFFTIRTYFYDVKSLERDQISAVKDAVLSMSDQQLRYKGLFKQKNEVLSYLDGLMN